MKCPRPDAVWRDEVKCVLNGMFTAVLHHGTRAERDGAIRGPAT